MFIGSPKLKLGLVLATVSLMACKPLTPIATPSSPQAVKNRLSSSDAPLTLVHVWATWCMPCREEFPELMKVHKHFSDDGVQVILISADDPDQPEVVENFLAEHNSRIGSLISTELSEAFIEILSPQWTGSLPASFFYADGKLLAEWTGKRTYEQYAETIGRLLYPVKGD